MTFKLNVLIKAEWTLRLILHTEPMMDINGQDFNQMITACTKGKEIQFCHITMEKTLHFTKLKKKIKK